MNINIAGREKRGMRRNEAMRRHLLSVLVAGCFGTAAANPLGPQVVNGQASFVNQGNMLSVTNSPGAIINWQSFSINSGEITRFIQQNSNSSVLNRITGQDPSRIFGTLQSNGRVFLINPNGILFGQGAQVDVNGLVASTLNLGNEDFLKGKLDFKAGDKASNLKNQGAITTPAGGQVYLIAPNVENSGIITSPKGDVMLAAGHTVQLVDSINPELRVVLSAPEHEALNLGQIVAQGGKTGIYGALIKQRGVVNANSAVVGENGKIVFKASRDTVLEAGSRTTATGAGKGGEIQVLGERVGLFGDAQVDASGERGGGTILIGGDYQGRNADIPNAKQAVVAKEAEIKADATVQGDGGKVIVWSDEATRVLGAISARGGQQAGNGGFVETSGKQYLEYRGKTDLSAANGELGVLLLDPATIEIAGGSGDGDSNSSTTSFGGTGGSTQALGQITFANGNTGPSIVYQTEIENQSSVAHITLEATDKIFTSGDFTNDELLLAPNRNLTLRTRNSSSDASAPNGIDLTGSSEGAALGFRTQGSGAITIEAGTGTTPWDAPILLNKLTTASGAIAVSATGNVTVNQAVSSTSGNISISGKILSVDGPVTTGNNTSLSLAAVGAATLNANVIAGDSSTLSVQAGSTLLLGNGTLAGGASTDIILSSTGSSITQAGMTIQGETLSVTSASAVSLTAANMVDEIGGSAVTGFSFKNNKTLSVNIDGVTSDANVSITTDGGAYDISLYGPVKTASTTGTVSISAGTSGKILRADSAAIIEGNTINLQGGSTGVVGASASPIHTKSVGANVSTIMIGSASAPTAVAGAYLQHTGDALLSASSLFDANAAIEISSTGNLRAMPDINTSGTVKYESQGSLEIDADSTIVGTAVTLVADHIDIQGGIDAGAGTVALKAKTSGLGIDLGSTGLNGASLEISNAEIAAIDAGTIAIGDANSGAIVVTDTISANGKSLTLTGSAIAVTAAGSLVTDGNPPGNIIMSATGDIDIEGTVSADDTPAGGTVTTEVSLTSSAGDINFIGAGAGISAAGGDGAVKLSAIGGKVYADSSNSTMVTAPNVVIKAKNGITGPTDVETGLPTDFKVEADKLDLSNTTSGDIRVANAIIEGFVSVVDLDGDLSSIVQGASSNTVSIASNGDLSIDNDTSTLGTGTYDLFANGTLTVSSPVTSTSGSLALSGSAVVVDEDLRGQTVKIMADSLTVSANGMLIATGTPSSTSSGGMYIQPWSAGNLTLGASVGSDLAINPSILKSSAPTAGQVASGFYQFGAGGTVEIGSAVDLANSDLSFKASVVNVNGAVKGNSVTYYANTLALNAITTANGSDEGILIAPLTSSWAMTIDDVAPNGGLWIDSTKLGNLTGKYLEFGDVSSSGTPTGSGDIIINKPIAGSAGTFKNLGFATAGSIIQSTGADIISLPTCTGCGELEVLGGNINLNVAPNSVDSFAAAGNSVLFANSKALSVPGIIALAANGTIDVSVAGSFTSTGPIKSKNGHISIATTTGSHDIVIGPPGVNACYNFDGTCTSTVTLNATGSINIPLVVAGTTVSLIAGGDVIDGDGELNNLSVPQVSYSVGGNIDIDAWGATIAAGSSAGGTANVRLSQQSSGTGGGTVTPTLSECTSNPTLSGCSAVLPTVSACTATPTLAGCSAVLPTVDTCAATPTLAGCSVVLPTVSACTATPTLAGCSVVLPTMDACTATPTLAGCSVVLPTVSACTATPTLAGCSVVLPTVSACTATPTLVGCSVVLPTVSACTATPTLAGCSVVLPTVSACTATPTLAGCSVVLPTVSACTATPTLAGCSVVLPTMDACTATPTLAGCTAVLPSLSNCTATPTLVGCTVVLPTLGSCTANPAQAGCSAVLPTLDACSGAPTLAGCSAVLPTVGACTTSPSLPGCTAVLPSLSSCTATPTLAGCSAVLPTVGACAATPTIAGCTVVLPTLGSCTANPAQAGCSAVLPTLDACSGAPTLAGCSAVLPTLSQCAADANLAGCSVVVPIASQCTLNPALAGCATVLPSVTPTNGSTEPAPNASTGTSQNTVSETVKTTVNAVVNSTVSTQAATTAVKSGSGTASGGSGSSAAANKTAAKTTGAASDKPAEKTDDSKDEKKKTTSGTEDSGAKKNEPAKKMYCN